MEGRKTTCVNKRTDEYDVYIGRGSKWGNPFRIGEHGDRDEVVRQYRRWLWKQPELLDALGELEGRRIACYCAPEACHGDVLVAATEWWRSQQPEDEPGLRIAFTGDREWTNTQVVRRILESHPECTLWVLGDARGLDRIAGRICAATNLPHVIEKAKWDEHVMLAHLRAGDIVYAFHPNIAESKGTANCARQAEARGLEVRYITGSESV